MPQVPPSAEHVPVPLAMVQLFGLLQHVVLAIQVPPQLYWPEAQPQLPPAPGHTAPPVQSAEVQQVALAMQAAPQSL
jgi:hypothetical protein